MTDSNNNENFGCIKANSTESDESTHLDQHPLKLDEEGHLVNYTVWHPEIAQSLADTLQVTLTDAHYEILYSVREFYQEFNHPPSTRPLIKYLIKKLPHRDLNNQILQQMFKTGLVARHVNRIAGLPKPPNCL